MPGNSLLLRNKNLQLILCITFVSVIGVASITPAFPAIIRFFRITPQQVGWLIAAFTLPGVVLTPVTGVLADRFGRKPVLVPSLVLFCVAGIACAFTRDFHWLLFFRLIQGIGSASLSSINVTIIGDLFKGDERVAAMGYNTSVLSIGTASCPVIGGLLTSIGWQMVFVLPAIGLPLIFWVTGGLKNPEPESRATMRTYFANVWRTVNRPVVWALFGVNCLLFMVLYGAYLTYFPLMLETRMGSGAVVIGISMSLMSVITAATSSQLPVLSRLLGAKQQLILGTLLYLTAMLILSQSFHWAGIVAALVIFGFGHGMAVPLVQNLMVGLAGIRERAAFMSLSSTVLRLGQTLGPLFVGLFYAVGGVTFAFFGGAAVTVVMLVVIVFFIQPKPV